jgi:hypothetical protein
MNNMEVARRNLYTAEVIEAEQIEGVDDRLRRGIYKPHYDDGYYHGLSGRSAETDRKGPHQQAYDRGHLAGSRARDRALNYS